MNRYRFDEKNHVKWINLIGTKFNYLTIIKLKRREKYKHQYFLCKCDCGEQSIVDYYKLKSGTTKSCGCYITKKINEYNYKHGMSKTRTYRIWKGIITRCLNKNNPNYFRYGGRGIKICNEWMNYKNFYRDMGETKYGMTIERINNNGYYEKSNCKWADKLEQANNRRDNNKIEFNGKTQTMQQWANETGIKYGTINQRINVMKWDVNRALTTDPSIYKDR